MKLQVVYSARFVKNIEIEDDAAVLLGIGNPKLEPQAREDLASDIEPGSGEYLENSFEISAIRCVTPSPKARKEKDDAGKADAGTKPLQRVAGNG
jgi:hypothetical protein